MMTRKNFEAIAHTLDANEAPLYLVLDFADMLEEQNERFDRARFVAASTGQLTDRLSHDTRMLDNAKKGKA